MNTLEPGSATTTSRRKMASLGERRQPGTNQSSTENYLANHPISNLTQSTWRRDKDTLPSIEGNNLNKTGVFLPKISNVGNLEIGAGLHSSNTLDQSKKAPA